MILCERNVFMLTFPTAWSLKKDQKQFLIIHSNKVVLTFRIKMYSFTYIMVKLFPCNIVPIFDTSSFQLKLKNLQNTMLLLAPFMGIKHCLNSTFEWFPSMRYNFWDLFHNCQILLLKIPRPLLFFASFSSSFFPH